MHIAFGTITGIDGAIGSLEITVNAGGQSFAVQGLPDDDVLRTRSVVCSALAATGFTFPSGDIKIAAECRYSAAGGYRSSTISTETAALTVNVITINLAPADIRKQGPVFDLPIAVGLLAATGQVRDDKLAEGLFIGELALDGTVSPVPGVLPIAIKARADKKEFLVVPAANAQEAAIVGDVKVYPVKSLADVVVLLNDFDSVTPITADPRDLLDKPPADGLDFLDVKGQEHVKRALEVASAGGHNAIMFATVAGPFGLAA